MVEEQNSEVKIDVFSRQIWIKPCLTLLTVGETAMAGGCGVDGGNPMCDFGS